MTLSILMTIVDGSWEEGFLVQLFLINNGSTRPIHQPFRLPAAPSLRQAYDRWQQAYRSLEDGYRKRIIVPDVQWTNDGIGYCSDAEYNDRLARVSLSYTDLLNQVGTWFEQPEFTRLELELVDRLPQGRPTRLVLSTNQESLWKVPWHLWSIYRRRPEIEVVLNGGDHSESSQWSHLPRVLIIVGNKDGIDITSDLESVYKIPKATIELLQQPNRDQLKQALRSGLWDIIIYVGHSSSNSLQKDGVIVYSDDPQQVIRLSDLESSVRIAVANGLKLMIFNSCDGLGLTQPLLQFGVPNVIVMRESVPDPVAHQFLDNFLNAFVHRRLPLSLAIREARVQLRGDDVREHFPGSQDLPVLYQGAYGEDLRWPEPIADEPITALPPVAPHKQEEPPRRRPLWPIAAVAILGVAALALWPPHDKFCQVPGFGPCPPSEIQALIKSPVADRLSLGDKILIKQPQNPPFKAEASRALRRGNYSESVRLYSKSLEQTKNDPEAVIYLNNAHALQVPHLKIALVVPIGSNPNVAQEMMRGIAQYQDEVNHSDGINGKQLVVLLANDDNREGPAEAIARELVADPTILAVVGHNATNASLAAAPIYQEAGLPMVLPTSMATQLTQWGSYIFRATSDSIAMAEAQASYLQRKGYKKIAFCYDSSAADNQSYQKELTRTFQRVGGLEMSINCDIATAGFDADAAIREAIEQKVDVLALAPHIDRIHLLRPVLEANQRRLPLIGSVTLYTGKTLELGKELVEGLIAPAPWNPWLPEGQHFAKKAEKFWGGRIVWRTATTYDATAAVVLGLRMRPTRTGLAQVLRSPDFLAQGSGAPFRFDPVTGERGLPVTLMQIFSSPTSSYGIDFRPIGPVAPEYRRKADG